MMDNPAARRIIQACMAAGEQTRLLPEIPMKMKLADATTALLPLSPGGTAGAVLIRAPVIVTAVRGYFEMLWERATQDEVIARRARISLTTVRRHVAAIMEQLDVTSRFAASAAAHRRGWIE